MKGFAIIVLLLFCVSSVTAQEQPELRWANIIHQRDAWNCLAPYLAQDREGNVYASTTYADTLFLGPTDTAPQLLASGRSSTLIYKLNRDGVMQWKRSIGNDRQVTTNLITSDSAGNILVAGVFQGKVDFDPGPGVYFDSSGYPYGDRYIIKLDSNGAFRWARTFKTKGQKFISGILLQQDGTAWVSGSFKDTLDLDPGPGHYLRGDSGSYTAFLLSLDANGSFLAAKVIQGPGTTYCFGGALAQDSSGRLIWTGSFSQTVDLDPDSGVHLVTSHSQRDAFIMMLDSRQHPLWIKAIQGNCWADVAKVAFDRKGNIWSVGSFAGRADFDPGPDSLYLGSSNLGSRIWDGFVQKMSNSGDFIFANRIGGGGNDYAVDIAIDAMNQPYIIGYFSDTLDFDPDPSIHTLWTSINEGFSIYVLSSSEVGKFKWVRKLNCPQSLADRGASTASAVLWVKNREIVFSGSHSTSVDLDPTAGVSLDRSFSRVRPSNICTTPPSREFVVKWSLDHLTALSSFHKTQMVTYPNPTTSGFTLTLPRSGYQTQLRIKDVLGKLVYAKVLGDGYSFYVNPNLPVGVYTVIATTDGLTYTSRICIQ